MFKTKRFARDAQRARIADTELCKAIAEVAQGKADDLGGGVMKKRLSKNQYRSIILMKSGVNWVYEYLYAKQNRANIEDDELVGFKKLAGAYANLRKEQADKLVQSGDFVEICK